MALSRGVNVNAKTVTFLQRNIGENLCDPDQGTTFRQVTESKNKKGNSGEIVLHQN